jgi:predicted GIY-YIG superfamily endonuclease
MGQPFFTYMLCCADGKFYVGQTDNLEHRLNQHTSGEGCEFTRTRLPVSLVWSAEFATRDEAKAAEQKIKKWSRAKKQALTEGRFDLISQLGRRDSVSRALRGFAPQGRGE